MLFSVGLMGIFLDVLAWVYVSLYFRSFAHTAHTRRTPRLSPMTCLAGTVLLDPTLAMVQLIADAWCLLAGAFSTEVCQRCYYSWRGRRFSYTWFFAFERKALSTMVCQVGYIIFRKPARC